MAAGLIAHRLAARGVEGKVLSAGLLTEGREASAHGVDVMAGRGIDISTHRSRVLSANLVAGADLIVCMERQHVREVAVIDPDAFVVTFTLPELARRATEIGPRSAQEAPDAWLRRASAGRRPADLLGENRADEIDDPYGRSARHYSATADEIEHMVDIVIDRLFPAPSR